MNSPLSGKSPEIAQNRLKKGVFDIPQKGAIPTRRKASIFQWFPEGA